LRKVIQITGSVLRLSWLQEEAFVSSFVSLQKQANSTMEGNENDEK
jgi:hypothetical protein